MNASNVIVHHDRARQRFVIELDGVVAELVYELREGNIAFLHTGVPDALGGRGIGGKLAAAGLDYAARENLLVLPYCPFVAGYIKKNPQRHAQVAPRFRD